MKTAAIGGSVLAVGKLGLGRAQAAAPNNTGPIIYVGTGRFELVELGDAGDVSGLSALQLEEDAIAKDILRMQRPEDGAWDPRGNGNYALYFVTTASISPLMNSRLWRLTFDGIEQPEAGGRIDILLTNTPGRMFDNVTIDRLGEVAHHDPQFFEPGGAFFLTQDEESSGIIDAHDILGQGWFLIDVQVHRVSADPELVQGGQLLAMYVPPIASLDSREAAS